MGDEISDDVETMNEAAAGSWLDAFLDKLQCPVTREALRYASDLEKQRAGIAIADVALANASGTHVYPIQDGIPRLLPENGIPI